MRLIYTSAVCAMTLAMGISAQTLAPTLPPPLPAPIAEGKRALEAKEFARAKTVFQTYLRTHAGDAQAELGLADAELGLHEYEAAEATYRRIVAKQPLLWSAHKNLVIVEAELGRWDDFDGERAVLHAARQRNAAGISPHESDVIDVITVDGQRWIVRDYFEPAGRSHTRYNFERFSTDGRVLTYVSLESADAFREELKGGAVVVGPAPKSANTAGLALNWYTGKSHGTITKYTAEPKYEKVRADFLKWVRTHPSQ